MNKIVPAGIMLAAYFFCIRMQPVYPGSLSFKNILADTVLYDSCCKNRVYGAPPFVLTNNISGKKVIYTSSDTTVISIKGDTATIHKSGTVNITGQIENDSTSKVTKKITIYKKPLYVSTPDVWRYQNEPNPKFVLIYDGFVNGEDESVLAVKPVVISSANYNSPPGKYKLSIMGGNSDKYAFYFNNTSYLYIFGVALDDNTTGIELYPNPSNDKVYISGISEPVTVQICSSEGKILKNIHVSDASFTVDGLEKGFYLILISSDNHKSIVRKLRVE